MNFLVPASSLEVSMTCVTSERMILSSVRVASLCMCASSSSFQTALCVIPSMKGPCPLTSWDEPIGFDPRNIFVMNHALANIVAALAPCSDLWRQSTIALSIPLLRSTRPLFLDARDDQVLNWMLCRCGHLLNTDLHSSWSALKPMAAP